MGFQPFDSSFLWFVFAPILVFGLLGLTCFAIGWRSADARRMRREMREMRLMRLTAHQERNRTGKVVLVRPDIVDVFVVKGESLGSSGIQPLNVTQTDEFSHQLTMPIRLPFDPPSLFSAFGTTTTAHAVSEKALV
ncbi:hypothetical protein DL96DRAFT_1812058 [Flagelloscypha sp. PMI_526]|nr:hypothetical protein DL96DRAFT_1812058 [Flagelloscypha sp. PMI_526]